MEYILVFLEGIASFISPCVLPLVPIYISYFAGQNPKKNKAITNSIAFVIGYSFVFTILAVLANRFGMALVGFTRYIKIIFGSVIILLGLNYMDVLKIKIFDNFKRFQMNAKNLNFLRALLFGTLFSISITPCVGTFLTSALILIATKTELFKGIVLIILYCLGLGIPFIISAILIDKLKNIFGFIKKNYKIIKLMSGLILIIMGVYLIFF
ncbi:MAG: cytochrome c biogenesis CcdA family protein [Clostridia bacterium]|nr:cytochrome c biogenesis CcdA family protein [Clostridia bacterium]